MKTRSQTKTQSFVKKSEILDTVLEQKELLEKLITLQKKHCEILTKTIRYKKFALTFFKNSDACPTGMDIKEAKKEFLDHIENETLDLDVLGAILGGFPFESFDKTPKYLNKFRF